MVLNAYTHTPPPPFPSVITQAIRYYEGALAIFVTQCGKDHPDVASTYNNLANAYAGKDDYDTAVDYYSKALDMLKGKGTPPRLVAALQRAVLVAPGVAFSFVLTSLTYATNL